MAELLQKGLTLDDPVGHNHHVGAINIEKENEESNLLVGSSDSSVEGCV